VETLRINAERPEPHLIAHAARIAGSGVPIAFPTDTVYGIGVAALKAATPAGLFDLKERDATKAIPWLVADARALELYAQDVYDYVFSLAQRHWPGALTLVVRASAAVPKAFRGLDGTIALRAPGCPLTRALIDSLGVPLATSSANRQGEAPATSAAGIDPRLAARLALVIDGGPTPGAVPSTVLSCLRASPCVLREGALPAELLLN
jgi:L-threonylcarbamoyladenylate synthase